jgi:histidinol-phosphate aminotransferase
LGRIIAPYPLASPVIELAMRVLQTDMQLRQQELLHEITQNKKLLLSMLRKCSWVLDLWPGEANFVLLRVKHADRLLAHCASQGVVVRGYAADPVLRDCIRISVGSKADLAGLQQALDDWTGD